MEGRNFSQSGGIRFVAHSLCHTLRESASNGRLLPGFQYSWSEGARLPCVAVHGTWASRNHQQLITCAWLPSASPWLPIPARESSPGHQERREESYWILRICLLWLSKKPFIFGHPKVGKKKPTAEGICLSVPLKEIWVSMLIIGTKFPRRQSVTIKTYGMCFDSFIFVFQK